MPRDQEVRATPRNSALGALADFIAQSYSPERTQQMQGVAKFLDMPSISETLDRLSYDPSGRSLFTGAGGLGGTTRFRPEVLDAAIAVAPGAGALGKLAAQGTMAAGRAGARLAERAVPRIMERGGIGAEMLQGMSRNTVSPMDVYRVLNEGVKGPQSEALRLAQQRAALPPSKGGLGLPANNTPQQRARAMDFEERGFHETEGANIENGLTNFDVRRAGAAVSDEQTPYAMFIKPNPAGLGIAKNNPAQMPLMVKSNLTDENIMRSFSNRDELQQYLDQFPHIKQSTKAVRDLDNQMANYMDELSKKMDKLYAEGKTTEADNIYNSMTSGSPLMKAFDARMHELAATSKEQITDLFKSQGVGTVGLRDDAGALGRNTITEMVLDPNENVRSRFAAFDPFRKTAAVAAAMGVAAPNLMAKETDEEILSQPPEYQAGGVVKLLKGMLSGGEKALTAAQRAEAGRAAAELIKSQDQVKASEALGQLMEKGFKQTTTTQADRTRVGSGNIGGAPFPALSQADPAYAGKVWGVMDEGTASRLKNLTTPDTAWTTMLGSAIQLKTNPVVFDKLKRQFVDSMKRGNLSDELAGKINHNLSLTFGEGADIRDPGIWKLADTFEKRAALADAMMGQGIRPGLGGVALGGEKSGRGVIFRPTDTLIRETEPYLLPVEFGGNVPTYAAGPRLFSLEQESMYRPDLHPGFPTLIKGEDLNYNMMPTPTEVYLPDWHARFKANNPERKAPGYYDLALGVKDEGLPSQALNDAYIQHLLREGYAEGGAVHMDEGGAAFGVFPQMKARRAQQDREAAANAPLSALRGWAAGTAGLAGDIEGLARAGISQLPPQLLTAFPALRAFGIGSRADPTPQLPTTEFYNEYLPGAQLNATPTGQAFTTAGNLFGGAGSTTLARYGIKSAKATAKAIAEAAPGPASGSRAAQLGVIKMPGGNFLKGEVEDSVSPMKRHVPSDAELARAEEVVPTTGGEARLRATTDSALNTFIDKKIVPYIKSEMATPDDPLRAMAEKYAVDKPVKLAEVQGRIDAFAAKMEQTARDRGVPVEQLTSMRQQMIGLEKERELLRAREGLHFTPEDDAYSTPYIFNRSKAGTDIQGMGQSPSARRWENASDSALSVNTAADILKYKDSFAPWLYKVPPETKVYRPRNVIERTGFDHLVDELRNATNPASGLPKNLLIDPADLGKLTLPQAVDRVADINAWRATQKAEANQLLANNAATQLVKEYPGQGVKWVELNQPKAVLEEGHAPGPVSGYPDMHGIIDQRTGQSVSLGATPEEALGLYKRQERYKTLEDALKYEGDTMQHCVGGYCPDVAEGRSRIYSLRDDKGQPRVTIEVEPHNPNLESLYAKQNLPELYAKYSANRNNYFNSWPDFLKKEAPELLEATRNKITQIKGFKNKKPADEFLPFVQDFVKSGNWSDVRDLKNSGLKTLDEAFPDYDMAKYFNRANPDNRYISQKDIDNFTKEWNRSEPPPEGMAHGGLVSTNFDPIKIQQIIARMDDDFDPERIQQIVAQRESAYA